MVQKNSNKCNKCNKFKNPASRSLTALNKDHDIVTDTIDLYDGADGQFLRHLKVPGFISDTAGQFRLLERNDLPGDAQIGIGVETFRSAVGYDPNVSGPESYALLLRAIARWSAFREEFDVALEFLDEASPQSSRQEYTSP